MKSLSSVRLGLTLALALATGIVTDAQTNWPTAKATRAVATPQPKAVQIRKPRSSKRRATARTAANTTTQTELLRSMAELVTRQAAAIEALARRLEAAESRLEQLAAASEAPAAAERAALDEAQAPFRASLAIDWSEVIGR